MEVPNKIKNIEIFIDFVVRKYFVEIGGVKYPKEAVNVNYAAVDYIDQNRDPKFFY